MISRRELYGLKLEGSSTQTYMCDVGMGEGADEKKACDFFPNGFSAQHWLNRCFSSSLRKHRSFTQNPPTVEI